MAGAPGGQNPRAQQEPDDFCFRLYDSQQHTPNERFMRRGSAPRPHPTEPLTHVFQRTRSFLLITGPVVSLSRCGEGSSTFWSRGRWSRTDWRRRLSKVWVIPKIALSLVRKPSIDDDRRVM